MPLFDDFRGTLYVRDKIICDNCPENVYNKKYNRRK